MRDSARQTTYSHNLELKLSGVYRFNNEPPGIVASAPSFHHQLSIPISSPDNTQHTGIWLVLRA